MTDAILLSIGYGTRPMEEFISLLKQYRVSYLIDVRSIPYSKNNQKFNKGDLTYFLSNNGIRYVFMGDLLGGRPNDADCYNEDGKVDYFKLKSKSYYQKGINRLKTSFNKGIRTAIMCSELNPAHCHRTKLIGMSLLEDLNNKIVLQHIDEFGKLKDQAMLMNEINKGKNPTDLFNNTYHMTSVKSYI